MTVWEQMQIEHERNVRAKHRNEALIRYDAIRAAFSRYRAEALVDFSMPACGKKVAAARQALFDLLAEALVIDGDPTAPWPAGIIDAK